MRGIGGKLADIKVFDNGLFAMLQLFVDQKTVSAIQDGPDR